MQPPKQHSWINLGEIKGQLIKKLGLERSKQYLDYLNRFLSFKLSKSEFDKLCLRTIGKDNIRLHNQLIRAVLRNACTTKPSIHNDPSKTLGNKKPSDGTIHNQNGPIPLTLTNGDILPPSPRKARSGARERRVVDRKSALNPNGNLSPDTRITPHPQELKKHQENGDFVTKDEKALSDRTSLHAPLGVPFCPVSIGGARALPSSSKAVSVLHTDGLLDTPTLKERMEQIVTSQGLQRVSMDCANVLNNGLNAYLKGLIRSCVDLNGGKSIQESTKTDLVKHPSQIRSINGVRMDHNHHQEHKRLVTLLDFRVAMELNCKQLGEDWPVLLEKICTTHDFEE